METKLTDVREHVLNRPMNGMAALVINTLLVTATIVVFCCW
jgi:hypothetical protein